MGRFSATPGQLAAKGGVTWIEVEEFRRQMDCALGQTVIDVRGRDEFAGPLGHIVGARNLHVDELPTRLTEINALKDKPVTLVCLTDRRSANAAVLLRDAGFGDVNVLRGGMKEWNRNGLAVEGSSRS